MYPIPVQMCARHSKVADAGMECLSCVHWCCQYMVSILVVCAWDLDGLLLLTGDGHDVCTAFHVDGISRLYIGERS